MNPYCNNSRFVKTFYNPKNHIMNFKNFFLAVLVSVIIAFSTTGNFSHTKEPTVKTFTVLISTLEKSGECTYARVFKDGIVDICI